MNAEAGTLLDDNGVDLLQRYAGNRVGARAAALAYTADLAVAGA